MKKVLYFLVASCIIVFQIHLFRKAFLSTDYENLNLFVSLYIDIVIGFLFNVIFWLYTICIEKLVND
jgi:hypothetical protein